MISSLSLPKLGCACVCVLELRGLDGDCVCVWRGSGVGGWGGRAVGQLSVKPNKSFRLSTICMRWRKKGPVICWMTHPGPTPFPPPLTPPYIHPPPPHLICMCMACAVRCTIGGSGAPVSSSGPNTEAIVWACRCLGSHAAPSAASGRWEGAGRRPWQEWEESGGVRLG